MRERVIIFIPGTSASFGTKTTMWKQRDKATDEMQTHRGQSKTSKAKEWENAVRTAAATAMAGKQLFDDGPIRVWMYCQFPMTGQPRKREPKPAEWKDTSPDIDKILRLALDGLQNVVFANDSQVASCICYKRRAPQGEPAYTILVVEAAPPLELVPWL